MSYGQYLKDRWVQLLLWILLLFGLVSFGILADIPEFYLWVTGIGIVGFGFLNSYLDYRRKESFFRTLEENSRELDKLYLLPELLEEPDFLEGKLLLLAMRDMEGSMAEQIYRYEKESREYKEFVELWVHEIKLPIATGKLIVENNRAIYDDGMMEELDKIENYAEQALFYARSNFVEKDYLLKQISLQQTAGEVIKKNRRVLLGNKIAVDFHDMDQKVYSDSKWLEFILGQILANSIKYMGNGVRKLEWYAKAEPEQVVLYLRDTGIGIEKKDLPRVFEKGFTGENGRIGKRSTGMGLYLCYKLCEKMGHRISIDSKQGEGCLVTIQFPKGSMTEEVLK